MKTGDWVRITAKDGASLDGFPFGDIAGRLARVDALGPRSVGLNIDWDEDELLIDVLPKDFDREPDGAPEAFRDLGKRLFDEMENPDIRLSGNGFFAEFDPLEFSEADEKVLRRRLPAIADDVARFLGGSLKRICETLSRRLRGASLEVPDLPDSFADRRGWVDNALETLDSAGRGGDFYPSYDIAQLFVEGDRKGNDVELVIDLNGTKVWGHFPNPERAEGLVDELWRRKRQDMDSRPEENEGKKKSLKIRP